MIGNGNFGTVNQGVMKSSGKGDVEVAVKTLKEGSVEQDRVRFLQEATIMGQFKHPNVVKLHGVVIEDEPVRNMSELMVCTFAHTCALCLHETCPNYSHPEVR